MSLSDQFNSLALSDLSGFVTSQQEENLFLDFKLVNGAELNNGDDKKNLARALSGFANSSGGLIIWGIEARKNAQGIDCAIGMREIDPVQLFISRLNELTGRAVNPIIEGVQHKPIPSTGNSGFAVTLVPESDSGPYMAKLGEDRYYKRSGDSFYRMEHFDLEDMFGRRKKPKLILVAKVTRPRDTVVLGIKNEGRGTAKAPYLSFTVPEPFRLSSYGVDGNGNDGLPRLHHGGNDWQEPRYGANSNIVIHPNTIHDVASIDFRGREENRPSGEIVIQYEITAEDTQIIKSSLTINIDTAGYFG